MEVFPEPRKPARRMVGIGFFLGWEDDESLVVLLLLLSSAWDVEDDLRWEGVKSVRREEDAGALLLFVG